MTDTQGHKQQRDQRGGERERGHKTWVVDEEQKKGPQCFSCSFLSSLVGGGHSIFVYLKGPFEKK